MSLDLHLPASENEKVCENCGQTASLVVAGIPQCNRHAGERIRDEFPEALGMLIYEYLKPRSQSF